MVLPLGTGRSPGQLAIGANGQVDESASLAEAARSCGPDDGDGILPATTGWTTVTLTPGRYELLCNIAALRGGHVHRTRCCQQPLTIIADSRRCERGRG
jgi:hypothetical protein